MTGNLTCVIIDDEQDAIELLAHQLYHLYTNIMILGTYTRWDEALAALRTIPCDIVFMDISMPGKTGINLLKLLPGLQSEIIFVTAYEEYAIDAFSFSTSGYILKPVDDAALVAAVNKAAERASHRKAALHQQGANSGLPLSDKIGIPNKNGVDYIDIHTIIYLESANKCTKIVTDKTEYLSAHHLGKYNNLITQYKFYQVHRSFIINPVKIQRYESSGVVIMSNKQELPVSRALRNIFMNMFDGTT